MNLIYLIKTLNLISLIFIPLNYIFAVNGYNNKNGLIYLWLCIIGFLINYLNKQKSKLIYLPVVFLFLPLITAKSIEELIYLVIYCIMTILVIIRGMRVIRYDAELDIFKKGMLISLSICIISFGIGGIHLFSIYSAYYVIIYLVTSILLLRNLRFMEYNKDSEEGKRINNKYSVIIVICSALLSISYTREMVVKIIKNSYLYITELFMYLFSWFFLGVGYLMEIAVKAFIALLQKLGIKGNKLQAIVQDNKLEIPKGEEGKVLIDKIVDNPIFKIFIKSFVILLVVYIIIRLFRSLMISGSEQEEYSEEKEFILRSDGTNKRSQKGLFDFIRPKNNNEQIRLYYQKYMKKCIDRDIELSEKDTTEEIRNKSQIEFDKKLIDEIRNIYLKIRYGEKESTKETVKEMRKYYDNIKK